MEKIGSMFGKAVKGAFSRLMGDDAGMGRSGEAVVPADSSRLKIFRSYMEANLCEQYNPKVGIFWYSPSAGDVFGVVSTDAKVQAAVEYRSAVSCRDSEEYVWNRNCARGVESLFAGDFNAMPRGRVFYFLEEDEYDIMVGSWIHEYPDAVDKIKKAFNLTRSVLNVKVMTGPQWEISEP